MRPIIKPSNPLFGAIALVGLVSASSVSLAVESEFIAMQKCKALQDHEERLACYDGISSQAEPEVATVEAPQSAPKAPPSVAPVMEEPGAKEESGDAAPTLDDEIGRESLGPKDGEQLMVRGQVVSCRENLSSKYVFTFANGQVWQQKDNKRVPWKECDFEVIIKKDFFGYIMQRPGEKKQIRIARVK